MSNIINRYRSVNFLFSVFFIFITTQFEKAYGQDIFEQPLSLGITVQLPSAILNETRTVNIYMPEGYNSCDSLVYPVVYILDGGLQEDFIHITGIIQYNSQPWVNRTPKSIVVGIENTNRKRDFTFHVSNPDFLKKMGYNTEDKPYYGGSANYIAFLEKELQPFIEAKFKTTNHRTIIGESLAGLLATEILLKYPQLFDNYIIISPSLWWGEEVLLNTEIGSVSSNDRNGISVYIGAPNKKEDSQMFKSAKRLYKLLLCQSYNSAFDYIPQESHSTVIHQAVYNAIDQFNSEEAQEL